METDTPIQPIPSPWPEGEAVVTGQAGDVERWMSPIEIEPRLKTVDVASAAENEPPELDFVLPGLLAGTVGLLAGTGGVGKSILGLQIATAVASGRPVAGWQAFTPAVSGPVVYVAAEDPAEVIHRRVHAVAAVEPWVKDSADALELYSLADAPGALRVMLASKSRPAPNKRAQALVRALAQDRRLLILDPLRRAHGLNELDSDAMTSLLDFFADVAVASGCAILLLHHTSQSATFAGISDALAARGSTAITDGCRFVATLRGMSQSEANALSIDDTRKRLYARLEIPKCSYSPPPGEGWCWLVRGQGGVLSYVDAPAPGGAAALTKANVQQREKMEWSARERLCEQPYRSQACAARRSKYGEW